MTDNPWTDEHTELCVKMWNDGATTHQIGTRLGRSRNSVIGKVHRLRKIPGVITRGYVTQSERQLTASKARRLQADRARAERPVKLPVYVKTPEPAVVDATHAKPWQERRFGECSWIIGEPTADALCCGAKVHKRGWCKAHYDIGTIPTKEPTEKDIAWAQRRWAA